MSAPHHQQDKQQHDQQLDWQRVSPLTAIAEVFTGLLSMAWLVFLLLVDVESGGWQFYASIVLVGGTAIRGLVAYFTTKYTFGPHSFRVKRAFIGRSESSVLYSNVQGVDTIAPLAARLVGLVAVRVGDAAAGSHTDVRFVTPTVAESIIAQLAVATNAVSNSTPTASDAKSIYQIKPDNRLLLIRSVAHPGIAVVATGAATAAIGFGLQTAIGIEALVATAPLMLVVMLLGGQLMGGILTSLNQWNTTGSIDDRRVYSSSGLLEMTSRSTLRDRVQLTVVKTTPFDRRLGTFDVAFETADVDLKSESLRTFGAATKIEALDPAVTALVGAAPTPTEIHPSARRQRVRNRWLGGAVALLPVAIVAPIGTALAVMTLVGFGLWYSRQSYARARYGITEGLLVVQRGVFTPTCIYAKLNKIQAAGIKSSWFQRRLGVVTVVAMTAGKYRVVEVVDVSFDTAQHLLAHIKAAQLVTAAGP